MRERREIKEEKTEELRGSFHVCYGHQSHSGEFLTPEAPHPDANTAI